MSENGKEIHLFDTKHNKAKHFRCLIGSIIAIEGLIGAGKTTASNSIYHFLKKIGFKVKLFKEFVNNDLLKQYIDDMEKYSYTFQIAMVMNRLETYK